LGHPSTVSTAKAGQNAMKNPAFKKWLGDVIFIATYQPPAG